jgi:hypothetical protein
LEIFSRQIAHESFSVLQERRSRRVLGEDVGRIVVALHELDFNYVIFYELTDKMESDIHVFCPALGARVLRDKNGADVVNEQRRW